MRFEEMIGVLLQRMGGWIKLGKCDCTGPRHQSCRGTLAFVAAVQRPIAVPRISVPVGARSWRNLPGWYILAEDDRMITVGMQRFMADRMKTRVRAHPVDHTPGITAPAIVVDVILEAIHDAG